ncbi:MAG: dual specificity protein phosphatase [candidate division WOR-3 bacterium]
MNNADEIIPRLWLGNFASSQDLNFLRQHHIRVIINCTKNLPFLDCKKIYKYRVPVDDSLQIEEIQSMSYWIEKTIPIIASHYKRGRSILVHCAAGIQRSAIIVLSFLYQHCHYDPKYALILMRKKRPYVFLPFMNFILSFRKVYGDEAYGKLVR